MHTITCVHKSAGELQHMHFSLPETDCIFLYISFDNFVSTIEVAEMGPLLTLSCLSSSKLINLGLSGPNWKMLFVTGGHSLDFFIHILERRHCLIILVIGYKDFHSPIQTSIVIKICTNTIEISLNSFVTKGINRVTAKWEIQFNH